MTLFENDENQQYKTPSLSPQFPQVFCEKIMGMYNKDPEQGIMSCIIEACDHFNVDVEFCGSYLNSAIKDAVKKEATEKNLLHKDDGKK